MTKDAVSNGNIQVGLLLSQKMKESPLNNMPAPDKLSKYHSQPLATDYQRLATERKFKEVMS